MSWIFKLGLVAAALWSGYWFLGAEAQEEAFDRFIAESRAQGWMAESESRDLAGFPNRFDTTFTGLNFQTPNGQWGWQGRNFRIMALSYRPNHIIMAWDGPQVLHMPSSDLSANAARLRASVVVAPATNVPLERLQIEGEELALESPQGWAASIASLNGALFQNETTPTRYRLGLDLGNITLPAALVSTLSGGAPLPRTLQNLHLSARLDFDHEIDRFALVGGTAPKPVHAIIEPSNIIWGDSELTVQGTLSTAANGYIDGRLEFNVQGWQPLFKAYRTISRLTPPQMDKLEQALQAASGGEALTFSVVFENGLASIGPFTIGPAPVYPF